MAKLSSYTATTNFTGATIPLIQGGGNRVLQATSFYRAASQVIDFASVADNASSVGQSITVAGAAVGDFIVDATASGNIATTDGIFLLAKVTAANTVLVSLHNDSGSPFDAAPQTIFLLILIKAAFG